LTVVVAGAGVGGLACAVRLAAAGRRVVVLEARGAPGGKAGRFEAEGFRFDTGPSLLTMPWVFRELLGDRIELIRVEPVTRYRFADGTELELSADLPRAMEALESWSPGAGADWARFLGVCGSMWRASVPFLTGLPPWPPRRPRPGEPVPDPRDLIRIRPWHTLRTLARGLVRDPRLRLVIERFATYAGADPRRAPAALAVAGYVEHAFGAWHVPGGIYRIVEALRDRLLELGGQLRLDEPARALRLEGGRVTGVVTPSGLQSADAVVWNGDAAALDRLLPSTAVPGSRGKRALSLSGFALMLGVGGSSGRPAHHRIAFSADTDAEFDAIFEKRRPVEDPTLYVSASSVTDPAEAPAGAENWFVLVNAPAGASGGPDWDQEADGYESHLLARLAAASLAPPGPIVVSHRRTPADLERDSGAPGGAIYGAAPHGRIAASRRPSPRVRGVTGLWRVGGSAHPGGGLPLVMLGAATVARELGR
jgi:phytoene desaturase